MALTAEGQSIFSVVRDMERASHSLRAFLDQDLNNRGVVRCAITEGLGTFWILPHLAPLGIHPVPANETSLLH